MICLRAYKYRIYPNREQKGKLAVQFGHARFVYNYALNARKGTLQKDRQRTFLFCHCKDAPRHEKNSGGFGRRTPGTSAEAQRPRPGVCEFFQKRARYPRFKAKHSRQSIRYPQRFKIIGSRIRLPKVGDVKIILHRRMEGVAKNVTVSKNKSGRYLASVQCEVVIPEFSNDSRLSELISASAFRNPFHGDKDRTSLLLRKSEKRLVLLQRRLSKKKKGSANRGKMRLRVARLHEHVANQRKDFLDRQSYRLTTQFGAIGLESLNIRGMVRNHCLANLSVTADGACLSGSANIKPSLTVRLFIMPTGSFLQAKSVTCVAL